MENFFQSGSAHFIVRVFGQAVFAFVLAMLLTPVYTHFAFKRKWWKKARTHATTGEEAPIAHQQQAEKHQRDIPTMAGIVGVVTAVAVTVVLNLSRSQTYLPLFVLVAAGLVGLIDDYVNIRGSANLAGGLRAKVKFFLILGIAILGGLYFYYKLGYSQIHIPAVGDYELGWLYIPLFIGVVASTANAVNITDGLDGLAGGLLATAFGSFGVYAFLTGNIGIAGFCATMVGVLLAYTWFNIFPCRFLMGDTGAFAFGTALGVVAMLLNSVFILPIICGVFVLEGGSSLVQILSKKLFKRKVFISAPLHHHLIAIGWPETKVTMRLWVIGQMCGAIGLMVGLLGSKIL